mmetsp:Transcript_55269/g.85949  ORF Transcript_55269/g.85949 Transcript_55269/m.85949 type:complete len:257 (-) Transcript_55269:854-1624(-)
MVFKNKASLSETSNFRNAGLLKLDEIVKNGKSYQHLLVRGSKLFRQEIQVLVDKLIQAILLSSRLLGAYPPFWIVPSEPCDSMEAISLESFSAVQGAVIVNKKDITWLHGQSHDIFFSCTFYLIAVLWRNWPHVLTHIDISHANLWHAARPAITQIADVIVCVTKPYWHVGHWMAVDWRFHCFNCLQTPRFAICLVHHFEIHVELWCDSILNKSLETITNCTLPAFFVGERRVDIGHRNANTIFVETFQRVCVHVS